MSVAYSIPAGYKQSELGMIPEDWEVGKLGNVTDVIMGQSPAGATYNNKEIGMPLINGPTEFTKKYPIKIQWTTEPTKICKKDDVLLCVRGSSTGRINISDDQYCIGRGVAAIRAKSDVDQIFIIFQVDSAVKNILASTTGSTFPNIDGKSIRAIQFPLPTSKKEQTAIATVLSDTDVLIERLDKIITKKKAIKQGAMQQLLTGEKRLPGFSGEWEVKLLGEVADVIGGGTPSTTVSNYWNGDIDWFTPTEIGKTKYAYGSVRKLSKEGLINSSAKILNEGTILMTSRAGIGDLAILKGRACTNQGFQNLIPMMCTDSEFLYYLMLTKKSILLEKASGSTFLEISPNNVRAIQIKIPEKPEQTAIAIVLSNMDKEIVRLEQMRDKYTMLKQGMMQQLLTGNIRLI